MVKSAPQISVNSPTQHSQLAHPNFDGSNVHCVDYYKQHLSSRSFVDFSSNDICPARIPQTIIEKVFQKYAVGLPERKAVKAGDCVMIRPEHVTLDPASPGTLASPSSANWHNSIGAAQIHNPVFTLNHDVKNKPFKNLYKYTSWPGNQQETLCSACLCIFVTIQLSSQCFHHQIQNHAL